MYANKWKIYRLMRIVSGTNTMPNRYWKGISEDTVEVDRVAKFSV